MRITARLQVHHKAGAGYRPISPADRVSTPMRRQDQYQPPHPSSFAKTAMACNGLLSSIHEIESRWNIQSDAMLNLSIPILSQPILGRRIVSTLERVATKIITKVTDFSMRMNVTPSAGLWHN